MKRLTMISKTALRLFALLLCLAAAVPQVGATARVYVRCDGADPNSSYLYVWGSSEAMGGWRGKKLSEMSSSNFNGYTYYYVDINQSTIHLILNSSNGGQTPDIDISNSGSYYITYKGGSNYSGPAEVPDGTFYVVGGDTSIFPNAWNTGTSTLMTYSGGTYSWTSSQVHLDDNTNYEYKVRDHAGNTWYPSGDNATFSVTQSGTYTVTITLNNGSVSCITNLIQPDTPTIPDYYITGDSGLGLAWGYAPTTTMTYDATNQIYTYSYNVSATGTYSFIFADGQGSNWNDFNNNRRIGPRTGDETYTLNSGYTSTQKSGGDHGAYMVTVGAGMVTITFDAANMQFKVDGTAPVINYDYYVVGDIFPNGWNTGSSNLMTDNGDGTYSWTSGQIHLDMSTNYEYKVYCSDGSYHPSGANATFNTNVPGTYTVTVTYNSNNGNVNAVLDPIQADPSYNYTFYVLPDDANVTPTLYLWGTNNNNYHPNQDWPGSAMNDTEVLADDNTWHKYTGTIYTNLLNAIVNDGGNGHQTGDIEELAPGTYYIRWAVYENSYTIDTTAPTAPDFYVVGDEVLIGYDWTINENTKMSGSGTSFTWSKNGIHLVAGNYNLKVKDSNGRWYGDSNGDNVTVTADANGTYTLNVTFDKSTGVVSATLTKTATDPTYTYNIYVRYAGNEDVNNVYAYVYDSFGNKLLGEWGGTKLTDMTPTVINGHTYYTTTVTSYDPAAIIILNENQSGDSQTENITMQVGDNYFTYQGGSTYDGPNSTPDAADPTYDYTIYVRYKGNGTPYMYLWDANGELLNIFPGTALTDNATFTTEVINGYTYYKYIITGSRYPSLGMILNEGGGEHQTADLSVPNGTHYYTYGGGNIINGPKDQADPAITYYAENDFYGWTTEGTQMTSDGQGGYTKTFSNVNLTGDTTYGYKVYGNDGTNEGVWYGDANGNNATFTPTVTGIYNVTITLNSDGTISHELTLVQATSQGTYYIMGSEGLGLTWTYAPNVEMTFDSSTGIYTYTVNVAEQGTYGFVFGNNNTAPDWDTFNGTYRIGPTNNNENVEINTDWLQTQMAGGNNGGAYQIHVAPGTVTIYLDPAHMKFKVEAEVPYYNYTFYILPDNNDVTPYVYSWESTGHLLTPSYPGIQLDGDSIVMLDDGNAWYRWRSVSYANLIGAIISGGGDESKTKDITNIEPGTYYIKWSTVRKPDESYNHYELYNIPPTPLYDELYLHGTYIIGTTEYNYSSSDGILMKYDVNTGNYYLNNVIFSNNSTFCFSTALGNDWGSAGTRYGNGGADGYTDNPDGTNYLGFTDDLSNRNLSLGLWSDIYGEYKMLTAGIYNILVNPDEHWVKLIKTDHSTLSPMNVYLEKTENVTISNIQEPGTTYTTAMFGDNTWPLSAYNRQGGTWSSSNLYNVVYVGDTITADGKEWWHWRVHASICDLFFTRTQGNPANSDTIQRHSGLLWVTWDEVNGNSEMTDHTREYFEYSANALPTNAVVMEGHYYVYFINTVGWESVYCYAWDNNSSGDYYDAYGRNMQKWPGHICECVGIDPETGYEVWRYDFGTIIGAQGMMNPPDNVLFNDGDPNAFYEGKEQTGDFEYINGGVYDYLGLFDGAFTLNNLIRNASEEVRYTVSNDLLAVYYDEDAITQITYTGVSGKPVTETIQGALYAKDFNQYGEKSVKPDSTYYDYVYDICASTHTAGRSQIMDKKTAYDQSNWVKLVLSPNYDGGGALPVAENDRPKLNEFVGHVIPAGTLELFMTDTINPTAHVLNISMGKPMSYEPNVYVSAHFNDTVVFNYTHRDWQLGSYEGNYECRPEIIWNYDDEGNVTSGTAIRHPNYDNPYMMYYVAPKPQEIAYITWVVYDNLNIYDENQQAYPYGDYVSSETEYFPFTSTARFLPKDPGTFYSPKNWNRTVHIEGEDYESLRYLSGNELETALGGYGQEHSPYSNGYMQYGAIKVNWSLWDEDEPWFTIFAPGQAYKIMAIIRYARGNGSSGKEGDIDDSADNFYYGPSNGEDSATMLNAPRRADRESTQSGYANMYFTREYEDLDKSKFIIFPIKGSSATSNGSTMGNVTTVKEVNVARTVVSVDYYNLMGIRSDKPFDGLNIVVTNYSDGSRSSKKILR